MRKIVGLIALIGTLVTVGEARAAIIQYQALMDGQQEVPPNASPGTGLVLFDFDDVANTLTLTFGQYSGMLANVTASHIHGPAPVGVNAGVLFNLNNTGGTTGTLSMPVTVLNAAQISALQTGMLYVNVHTSLFPGGEIRGQIFLVPAPGALALLAVAGLVSPRRRRRA